MSALPLVASTEIRGALTFRSLHLQALSGSLQKGERQFLQMRNLNPIVTVIEFPLYFLGSPASRSHHSEEQINITSQKAEAVRGLQQICLRPAPIFVDANESLHLFDQAVTGILLAQPSAYNPGAAGRVSGIV